jgi:predicted SPOUT superfamily RNA methylase MTH1
MCLLTIIIYFTAEKKKLKGQVVSPSTPQKEADLYWGYNVRLASSLGAVFTECTKIVIPGFLIDTKTIIL